MKVSLCIATFDKPAYLQRTLASIVGQRAGCELEIIVVDDGSPGDETVEVCCGFPSVKYIRIDRDPTFRNPSVARNVAYRAATGD